MCCSECLDLSREGRTRGCDVGIGKKVEWIDSRWRVICPVSISACLGREHEAQQLTHIVDFRFPAWILAYDILIDVLTGLSARSVLRVAAGEV